MMSYQKNDIVYVTIEDMGTEGEGIGHVDGFTLFVKDALIGDKVEVKIMKAKKHFAYARLMKILEPSLYRVEPKCAYARQCGGCQIQALSYEEQLRFKEEKVRNNLKRIGGFEEVVRASELSDIPSAQQTGAERQKQASACQEQTSECREQASECREQTSECRNMTSGRIIMDPIVGMEEPYHYRNKAQFPVGYDKEGKLVTGFYAGRTHDIISNRSCDLGIAQNQEILDSVLSWMEQHQIPAYDETSGKGLVRHVLIRYGFTSRELMVCLVINGGSVPEKQALIDALRTIEGMTSITYSSNTRRTNVIMGDSYKTLWGSPYITDSIGQVQYRISPLSFYQVNPVQTRKLYELALEYANLQGGETVWDLYCGIGTISLFLAQKAHQVYGVEIVPQAIEDARVNAALNQFTNAEFFVGKAEEVLPEKYEKEKIYADVIVVDPPRKGCETSVLDTMVQMQPKRIVYVSCDSATLARDLKYLCERGYEIQKLRAVDQFPMTVHVETVVLLSRKTPNDHIEVDLALDELDATSAETKATYEEIKDYVLKETGLKVSSLYISQIKRKCGLEVGENYNLAKDENARVPQCPKDKENAIRAALRHFAMI